MSVNSADFSPTMNGPQTAQGPQTGPQTAPGPQTGPLPYLTTPQVYNPTPHYNASPTSPSKRDNYAAKQSIGIGAIQVIIGIICIILQIVSISIETTTGSIGQGFWGGIFFLLSGAFGITAGIKKSTCMIIAHMVLSIASAVVALFTLTPSAIGVLFDSSPHSDYSAPSNYRGICNWTNNTYTCCEWRNGTHTCWEEPNPTVYYTEQDDTDSSERDRKMLVNALLLLFCFIEIIIAIWASVISCVGVCCGPPFRQPAVGTHQVQYVTGPDQGNSGQVMLVSSNGQALPSGQFAPQHPAQKGSVYQEAGGIQATAGCYNPPSYSPEDKKPSNLSPEYGYAPQGSE